MKVEREFLTSFLNLGSATELINTEFSRNSRLKKALWYKASHNETILWRRTIISTTRRAKKKIGVNQTASSDNIFKTGHLSNMSDPLMSLGNHHTAALNLTFIR